MIPINIAITGHRDLLPEKITEYENGIRTILKQTMRKYPDSTIQLLTGMAEGTDILGVKVALELGCSVIAVLPMAQEDFVKTFYKDKMDVSIVEFETIFAKVTKVIDLSKVYTETQSVTDRFVRLRVYLTENSQMIIALWNGVKNNKLGGTSNTVKFALEGTPRKYREKYSIIDNDHTMPVHYINVLRETEEVGDKEYNYIEKNNGIYTTLYPSVWEDSELLQIESYYDKELNEINCFNKNCEKYSDASSYLAGVNDTSINAINGMKKIIKAQAAADSMADEKQRKTTSLLIIQLIFGFLVFFWVALFDEIIPSIPYLLIFSPLFFLLCVVVYNIVNKRKIESRYYDYRALGECLRVQFYWKSVGIKENTYSYYSRKNECELGWTLTAVKNLSMDINYTLITGNTIEGNYDNLKTNWINDQLVYFKKKSIKNKKAIKKNKNRTRAFFGLGLLFVFLLIAERFFIRQYLDNDYLMHIFLFLIDVSLAGGAIFSGYLDKRSLEAEFSQFKRMITLFTQGIKEFDLVVMSGEKEEIQKTIVELGTDALAENADWVVYNRMSSIDIPLG